MFYDREDCTKLAFFPDEYGTQSGVFVFKNYFNDEQCKVVEDFMSTYDGGQDYEETLINWYAKRVSPPIPGLLDLWEHASDLLYPEYIIHPQNNVLIIKEGDNEGMFIHSDSPGKEMCHRLSQVDVWRTCCELDFGLVAYFGDFEGGEIFYVNINSDGTRKENGGTENILTYKPQRGDLVVHGAFGYFAHGVNPVTKGKRYAFSNFVLKAEDNPGTFYTYKTKEYYDQIGDRSFDRIKDIWMNPLEQNPQFTKERIKMMQESGLEGIALAEAFPFEHKKEKK